MKTEQLMEAIENIDDRYIEESAYGIRKTSRIPWGMIITAACFCVAIGATIFMQNMDILPHLHGTTATTGQSMTTEPSDTTVPSTTEFPGPYPTVALPSPEKFFGELGSLHNIALGEVFESAEDVQFFYLLGKGYIGKSADLTEQEKKVLDDKLKYGTDVADVWRLTKEQMDDAFWSVYGLTWEEVIAKFDPDSYKNITTGWSIYMPVYLEETGYYYGYHRDTEEEGIAIADIETEYSDDGTIYMFYTAVLQNERRVAKLQAHETGYYILSNEQYVDNTGKSEDQIAMETLFRDLYSWYNRAIACEYESPKEMSLHKFFYSGFKDEPRTPTDQEWEQLKDRQGFNINYDLFRLPVDKMNAVLTEYFGITLADMEPEAFSGLVYLESTNCYYHMATGWLGVENFEALSVQRMDDGRLLVRYPYRKYEYVVTLKPDGDGYRILSNVLEETFRPYAVDAAELDALFQEAANGNLTEDRRNEILLPLLGTFLEDPDLFVQSLGKQQKSQTGVVHIFGLNINFAHPYYAEYNQTICEMLPKVQSEQDKRVVYRMAFYSGLRNFLPQTPGAQDYALLFDMALYSDGAFAESCADWLKRYCMADPKSFTAAMALTPEENWEFNAQRPVSVVAATQEERLQIKESMNQLVAELSLQDGYGIYEQIRCAKMIIEKCDEPIG